MIENYVLLGCFSCVHFYRTWSSFFFPTTYALRCVFLLNCSCRLSLSNCTRRVSVQLCRFKLTRSPSNSRWLDKRSLIFFYPGGFWSATSHYSSPSVCWMLLCDWSKYTVRHTSYITNFAPSIVLNQSFNACNVISCHWKTWRPTWDSLCRLIHSSVNAQERTDSCFQLITYLLYITATSSQGGTLSVMVIVVGNGIGDQSSKSSQDCMRFIFTLGNDRNPSILPPDMFKLNSRADRVL